MDGDGSGQFELQDFQSWIKVPWYCTKLSTCVHELSGQIWHLSPFLQSLWRILLSSPSSVGSGYLQLQSKLSHHHFQCPHMGLQLHSHRSIGLIHIHIIYLVHYIQIIIKTTMFWCLCNYVLLQRMKKLCQNLPMECGNKTSLTKVVELEINNWY